MKIKLGMGKESIAVIAKYCGGNAYGNIEKTFEYICTDSREAEADTLFVAMRGERVDGHDFIATAAERGCGCFLCERLPDILPVGAGFCVVENSEGALFSLAHGCTRRDVRVVAVTGSVGKTTTKQLTSLVLGEGMDVYFKTGNYNSTIGMPLSFMEISEGYGCAVLEMGMSGLGEISKMSALARPTLAMVTCIGSSHLEYLKTRENIARAKLEVADGLRDGGVLLLSGDEPLLRNISSSITGRCRVMYVSMHSDGDFRAENIRISEQGSIFDVCTPDGVIRDIYIPLVGEHMVHDACFAVAAGIIFGITHDRIRTGLGKYVPDGFRQRIYDVNGIRVISDCYNAAPESVRSALSVLGGVSAKRRIAVLGDMRELGEGTREAHLSIGESVCACNSDILVTVGELGRLIAEGARRCGMHSDNIFTFDEGDHDSVAKCLDGILMSGDAVLFKASRSMRLECVMERTEKINAKESSVG